MESSKYISEWESSSSRVLLSMFKIALSFEYYGELKPERLAYFSPGHRPGFSGNGL